MTSTSAAAAGKPQRVLIVEDDTLVGMGLRADLEKLGHAVIGQASNAQEAIAAYMEHQPTLVLLDIRLNATDGLALAGQLSAIRRCAMIVVSAYSDPPLIERAGDAGVFGYLIKPVGADALSAQIAVAIRRFNEQEQLIRDKATLAQNLENRKLMDRAKGILMRRFSLDEQDAHRRLQQESQKRRISLVELAKKIIESEELLGGGE